MPYELIKRFSTSDPYSLAETLQLRVREKELPERVHGFIMEIKNKFFIVLNYALSESEKRFVCAHELAHYCLHHGLNYLFIQDHTHFLSDKYEKEAGLFAIRLLCYGKNCRCNETVESYYARVGIPPQYKHLIPEEIANGARSYS